MNIYLDNEMKEVSRRIKKNERLSNRHNTILFLKYMFFLFLTLIGFLFFSGGHCIEPVNSYKTGIFFPDTWKCSKCGYENYDGIGYCAICGTKR